VIDHVASFGLALSAGSPDSRPFKETIAQGGEDGKELLDKIEQDTMLKRMPSMRDIANAAVFVASPLAASITGVTLDITAGSTSGADYKIPEIAFAKKR
jgi:3-oxoacyl-[acyl-carrier protein] reductase